MFIVTLYLPRTVFIQFYSFSEALSAGTGLGSGGGSVLLQGVNCSGSEQYILDCPRSFPVGITQCTHVQDVGVACQPQIFPGIQCYILL